MTFRLATWNIEWFDRLFGDDGSVLENGEWSARYNVTKEQQAAAIAGVLRWIDADAVLIIEAPDDSHRRSTRVALETFAEWGGLRLTKTVIGFGNDTRQEIALMFDPERVTPGHAPGESVKAPRFDGVLEMDLDVDLRAERLVWSKPPLELDLETPVGPLHLIGVHAKAKVPHNEGDGEEVLRKSILSRRKQLGQCIWLRHRVEERLIEGRNLIVAGDFNDGPGLDRFETLFGRSGLEIVLGEGSLALHDPAAKVPRIGAAMPSTARFWDDTNKRYLNALLDFAMVSDGLRERASWRILHPFDDPEAAADPILRDALLDASDHFPVILDLAPEPAHF
ncbi:MAG: endonuclease/exonuclease/phosphatase family protein [Pseudomonadota bacterium]